MLKIDLKRLKADVDRIQRDRPANVGPGGRRLTGSMAVVRENLMALEAMKASRSWVTIASGLAAQGVTQGDGQPITAKRLTALIASVKRQDALKAAKQAKREQRQDAPMPTSLAGPPRPPSRLAPELTRLARHVTDESPATEEDLRRSDLAKVQRFLKPDNRPKD
jgi:hypothetical protein